MTTGLIFGYVSNEDYRTGGLQDRKVTSYKDYRTRRLWGIKIHGKKDYVWGEKAEMEFNKWKLAKEKLMLPKKR